MKLSTKSRYSVTALYELALHYGEGAVPLKEVSEAQGISENYLEQLMSTLRKKGLVQSVRGAQGGYMLAKSPCAISIGEIITAIEGPIALVDCLLADAGAKDQACTRAGACVTRNVWGKVGDSIRQVLNSITLKDLCDDNGTDENGYWAHGEGCGAELRKVKSTGRKKGAARIARTDRAAGTDGKDGKEKAI